MSVNSTPASTDLGRVITSPKVRGIIYAIFVVLLVVAGAITIAFAALNALPQWVIVMNAVLGYLGIPVGGLAVANVKPAPID